MNSQREGTAVGREDGQEYHTQLDRISLGPRWLSDHQTCMFLLLSVHCTVIVRHHGAARDVSETHLLATRARSLEGSGSGHLSPTPPPMPNWGEKNLSLGSSKPYIQPQPLPSIPTYQECSKNPAGQEDGYVATGDGPLCPIRKTGSRLKISFFQ